MTQLRLTMPRAGVRGARTSSGALLFNRGTRLARRLVARPIRGVLVLVATTVLVFAGALGMVVGFGWGLAGILGVLSVGVGSALVAAAVAGFLVVRLLVVRTGEAASSGAEADQLRGEVDTLRVELRKVEDQLDTLRDREQRRLQAEARELVADGELAAAVEAYERLLGLVATASEPGWSSTAAPDVGQRGGPGAPPVDAAVGESCDGAGPSVQTHPTPAGPTPADASPADASPADASPADASPADASPAGPMPAESHAIAEVRRAHLDVLTAQLQTDSDDLGLDFARAVDRQLTAGDLTQALQVTLRGRELAPASLRLRDREVSVLAALDRHDEALPLALEASRRRSRHLKRTRRERAGLSGTSNLDVHRRIAISGFFYSGSGAVKDALRGAPGAALWPPVGELRIVKFPGGFADLARRAETQGTLGAADLVDHYLHLVGRRWTGTAPGVYDRWEVLNANSRRLWRRKAETAGYLDACLGGFRSLAAAAEVGVVEPDTIAAHARTHLAAALDAAAEDLGVERLVIDQVVTAWQLEKARFLPPTSFVIVHRDPRDQFAEVRDVLAQPGRPAAKRDPRTFAARYRSNHERADRARAELESLGHRVLRLAFEDLVLEPEPTIARLAGFLGLPTGGWALEGGSNGPVTNGRIGGFDPAVSRRNVGKHVGLVPVDELVVLEDLLGDLCDERAVPSPTGDR